MGTAQVNFGRRKRSAGIARANSLIIRAMTRARLERGSCNLHRANYRPIYLSALVLRCVARGSALASRRCCSSEGMAFSAHLFSSASVPLFA